MLLIATTSPAVLRCQMSTNIGKRIRLAREGRGLSQAGLAKLAGCNQQTIDRLERGETEFSRYRQAILKVLDLSDFETEQNQILENDTSPVDQAVSPEIPVFATQSSVTGATEMTKTKVGTERRINSLMEVPNAYGFRMPGPNMAPIFRSGDLLLCHPFWPISPGDRAVFRMDTSPVIVIAELKDEMPDVWLVKTCQSEFALEKIKYPAAHLIVANLKS